MTHVALSEEFKVIKGQAMRPTIVRAAEAVAAKGVPGSTDEIAQATSELTAFQKQVGGDYEIIVLAAGDGIVMADAANGSNKGINMTDRDYFKLAMQGKASVETVVKSKSSGNPVVPLCAPVISDSGKTVGALVIVLKPDFFSHVIQNTKIRETGYAFLVDQNGVVIAHPDQTSILNYDIKNVKGMEQITQKALSHETGAGTYLFG